MHGTHMQFHMFITLQSTDSPLVAEFKIRGSIDVNSEDNFSIVSLI